MTRHLAAVPPGLTEANRRRIAAAMPEDRGPDSLEAHLRRLLDDLGLWGHHERNSIGSTPGWPDWVIIGTRIIYRELKSQAGKLTSEQRTVGYKIIAAGGSWKVWRPSDWLSGQIAKELGEIAGTAEMF